MSRGDHREDLFQDEMDRQDFRSSASAQRSNAFPAPSFPRLVAPT
jgi:hypothetical protein